MSFLLGLIFVNNRPSGTETLRMESTANDDNSRLRNGQLR